MTPFTLIMAYYDNPRMLEHHIDAWFSLPEEQRRLLHVRIVDDGSPRWHAVTIARAYINELKAKLASFELYRMGVDVPWNQDACRNLGASKATTDWLLMTDIDHVVPAATWQRLMFGPLDASRVYRFGRVSAPSMEPYKHHPNSWAFTRKVFWSCGGYDEALAGYYGTDGDFGRRLLGVSDLENLPNAVGLTHLPEVLIRYPREVIADASTTTLERKKPQDKAEIRRIIKERGRISDWRPSTLSFPFERVL